MNKRTTCKVMVSGCLLASVLSGCASPTGESGTTATTEATPVPPSQRTDEAVRQAEALREQGLLDAALAEFERAIAINPDLTVAYMGAGDIHAARGDYPAAEESYAAATRLDPRNFDAHYGRGLMLQLMDRVSEAIRSYLRALTI
ncbi:MAG: tetratricopeptide repeat protein, partial [Phycisphaerales bacterium]|nr:tetratricopeptide repeat protein [Phycisphaerales bacterium]